MHEAIAQERVAVSDVGVWLYNENQLFAGVVEVELDFVARRTDGLVSSELKLFDEVLVWVLGHAAALISVKENVIYVERGCNNRFTVSVGCFLRGGGAGASNRLDSEKALVKWTKFNVKFNLVILEGNKW